ncbi:hypothetical protein D9Q98_007994 [Chlorella vulgaris]|uniref:Disease resistance R13L4/SHOC-2-like LRR domain-containing protein n=1 Tax=Chlorella vulgaris TaxID=3077 RepID=A0A9D4THW8_CHLVU|nr:hypothetical protein D9Q98_007994 [Chlorella vulgaris]
MHWSTPGLLARRASSDPRRRRRLVMEPDMSKSSLGGLDMVQTRAADEGTSAQHAIECNPLDGEEPRNKQARSSGIQEATTSTTVAGAGEFALAALATPGPPQLTIVGHLEPDDRMRLGSACTSLRLASRDWFPEVTAVVQPYKLDVASLAAWLERHQAQLNLVLKVFGTSASASEWACSTIAALPAPLVSSCTASPGLPGAVSTLTALTSLSVKGRNLYDDTYRLPAHHLGTLSRLRQLSLTCVVLRDTAEELLSLPALKDLRALGLSSCRLERLPRAMSALTQLTALDLASNHQISALTSLTTLQRLQSLNLHWCGIVAATVQLSALTALTRLNLSDNRPESGWQHLLLAQLQDLNLHSCGLSAVPEQLSALTALTSLNLSSNTEVAGGWQYLLPLAGLRDLNLSRCGLTEVPQQASSLTTLTLLDLSVNWMTSGGWHHLLSLTQLQDLDLHSCHLRTVPEQLSVLTALTSLNLGTNQLLQSGWQHLLPLKQLRYLDLQAVGLSEQEASPLLAMLRADLKTVMLAVRDWWPGAALCSCP